MSRLFVSGRARFSCAAPVLGPEAPGPRGARKGRQGRMKDRDFGANLVNTAVRAGRCPVVVPGVGAMPAFFMSFATEEILSISALQTEIEGRLAVAEPTVEVLLVQVSG